MTISKHHPPWCYLGDRGWSGKGLFLTVPMVSFARPVPKRQWMQKGRRLPEGGVPFKPGAREPELTLGGGGGELSPFLAPGCVVTPSGARRGEWD